MNAPSTGCSPFLRRFLPCNTPLDAPPSTPHCRHAAQGITRATTLARDTRTAKAVQDRDLLRRKVSSSPREIPGGLHGVRIVFWHND